MKILGYLSEEELYAAYQGARVFCYPSLEEGFGLPLLEAMAVGTPVVSSNASCLPEIAGPGAILVDPLRVETILEGLRRLLTLPPEERAERIAQGYAWAARFTWANAATEYWDIYRKM